MARPSAHWKSGARKFRHGADFLNSSASTLRPALGVPDAHSAVLLCGCQNLVVMPERRLNEVHALATVIEHGPQTTSEVWDHLYPGGLTASRKDPGELTPARNPHRVQQRLDLLTESGELRLEDGRYHVGRALGTAMVIYLGRVNRYTAVFDAAGIRLDHATIPHGNEVRSQTLARVLTASIRQLADLMNQGKWEAAGPPRAVAVGLPAAVRPDGDCVVSSDPLGWSHPQRLKAWIAAAWERERARLPGLPPFPRAATPDKALAITIDSDVVMDTIGAMYERPSTDGAHHPAFAANVMGVKCSGGVRSTLVNRGEPFEVAGKPITNRAPGDRRDSVFRGRYGDTVGLGHSIALIHRARRYDTGEEDVVAYWEKLCESDFRCSCGTADVPHLETFASHGAVARRIDVDPNDLDEILRVSAEGPDATPLIKSSVREALAETGRLLGYALDLGVRLYDPEAVFLTGGVPYSDVIWNAIEETSELPASGRRSLLRVSDLVTDDTKDPIGPRGAAHLATDTWIYPAVLAPG
jgi:predicted NBD/HSP70 family sugar kinase